MEVKRTRCGHRQTEVAHSDMERSDCVEIDIERAVASGIPLWDDRHLGGSAEAPNRRA
jgi:hypothetical protein